MPVVAVRSAGGKIIGYRWGSKGKIYKTPEEAEAQGRAIMASGWKEYANSKDNCDFQD